MIIMWMYHPIFVTRAGFYNAVSMQTAVRSITVVCHQHMTDEKNSETGCIINVI